MKLLVGTFFSIAAAFLLTAQSPQFQYAALTGSGNKITMTRVPVTTAAGGVMYQDVTIQFDGDAYGNLTLSSGFPAVTASPNLQVAAFQPGLYGGPSSLYGGKVLALVSGPGILAGGMTAWALTTAAGADSCTYPRSASWYVGPNDANHPLAARLKKAGLTSNAWSYGTGGGVTCYNQSNIWEVNSLIGVNQVGNTLTIVSFTSAGTDAALPRDQITLTLVPTPQQ